MKNKLRLTLSQPTLIKGNTSKTPAESTMEDTSETIAIKTRKTLNPMEKTKRQTAAEQTTRIIAIRKIDAPKLMDVLKPIDVKLLAVEAIAEVENLTMKVMNTIVSSRRKVNKKRKKKLQVLKC